MMTNVVAIIPARSGSKSIIDKNIVELDNKPLIAHSIQTAIDCKLIEKVFVSTDSPQYAEIARAYGAEVPFLRPATLADDYTGTVPVIRHALEALTQQLAGVNAVCCIYPTAPLLDELSLVKGYEKLCDEHVDYCYPVTRFSHPVERALTMDEKGRLTAISPPNFSGRTQDMVSAYHDAGQFYLSKAESIRKGVLLTNSKVKLHILHPSKVIDIDTLEDFDLAEEKLRLYKRNEKFKNWKFSV